MDQSIPDAVQPLKWFEDLPRASWMKYSKVSQSQTWFDVYELPGDVLAIYEPGHFQEVVSFLIKGKEKSLLLDTGMGIGDMKKLVDELTDLPLTVVNSHCHFDHIGCNWRFPKIHVFNYPGAVERLKTGMSSDELNQHLEGDSTCIPYPEGFDSENYTIQASVPEPIEEGYVFELGGRSLEVIHTPGHSPDSIMLNDASRGILFTGDTYYPATMYAHLDSSDHIDSEFETYRSTIKKLADSLEPEWLYASHNEPVQPGSTLKDVAAAFDGIADGKLPYLADAHGLRKYDFDGFSIVTAAQK